MFEGRGGTAAACHERSETRLLSETLSRPLSTAWGFPPLGWLEEEEVDSRELLLLVAAANSLSRFSVELCADERSLVVSGESISFTSTTMNLLMLGSLE